MEDTPQHDANSEGERSEPSEERAGEDSEARSASDGERGVTTRERHARRAALYGYIATALQFPTKETVADLTGEEVRASIREAGRELDLADEVEALVGSLEDVDAESLEPAYNDLFGLPGDGGTYPVVPYEAEYTTDGDIGESQRRIATVVGLLEQFGLEVSEEFDERQDHVAVELELMQLLAIQRAMAQTDGEEEVAQRLARAAATVLDEHLVDFIPALAHAVDRAVDSTDGNAHEVYVRAADLAATLVETDAATHPDPVTSRTGGGSSV